MLTRENSQTGRVSPRNSSRGGKDGTVADSSTTKMSPSPVQTSPLHQQMRAESPNPRMPNGNGNGYHHGNGNGNGNRDGNGNGNHDGNGNGDGSVHSTQSAQQQQGVTAASNLVSASNGMPPLSQSSTSNGVTGAQMASIREERETSQMV